MNYIINTLDNEESITPTKDKRKIERFSSVSLWSGMQKSTFREKNKRLFLCKCADRQMCKNGNLTEYKQSIKYSQMKTDKNTNRKAGSDIAMPFDASDFIHQVSGAGSWEDMQKDNQTETVADLPKPVQTSSQVETPADTPETIEEKPAKRKRSQAVDYENLFLSRNELRNRQGLYIGRDNYETLQTLVRVIRSERLSVSGLVDNIISHHIELYGDDINRIYDENSRKPIKKR
jgi:hypothetical protein